MILFHNYKTFLLAQDKEGNFLNGILADICVHIHKPFCKAHHMLAESIHTKSEDLFLQYRKDRKAVL